MIIPDTMRRIGEAIIIAKIEKNLSNIANLNTNK
tara:strand:- start:1209 stop:1310 length:102 start_codon:yes stop_codon:yes gene_type:complete